MHVYVAHIYMRACNQFTILVGALVTDARYNIITSRRFSDAQCKRPTDRETFSLGEEMPQFMYVVQETT